MTRYRVLDLLPVIPGILTAYLLAVVICLAVSGT